MKKALIILALLLAVCSIEGRAAELNLTCTVDIIDGENYAECDGGSVSTNGTKVYATPRSSLFEVKSVVWRNGSAGTDLTADPLDDSYSAPQLSGFVTIKFGLRSENVTVTFDLNGLDGTAPADQEHTLGGFVTKPEPDPGQEGTNFHGWFMDEECTRPFDFNTPLDHTMPYQYRSRRVVLKLYAGWSGLVSSGTCGKVDDTHDGSQLRWALYRIPGSDTADSLVINGNGEMAEYAFRDWSQIKTVVIEEGVTTIGQDAFSYCTSLTSVTIPASVTTIGQNAFYLCKGLTNVYCYAASVPSTDSNAFVYSNYGNATLHVPATAVEDYQHTEPWSGFKSIVGDLQPLPKCATPTIAFANGELTFGCETEGVAFVYSITSAGSQTDSGSTVSLKEVPSTYTVSVYAVKDGYDPSDAATQTITYQTKAGDTNGDGRITISDAVGIVDIILRNY